MILTSATLQFVGWVEPILDYVGFRYTLPNLHFVCSIAQCETQQWPTSEPSPKRIITRCFRWTHGEVVVKSDSSKKLTCLLDAILQGGLINR
jgi:hypothetical protein